MARKARKHTFTGIDIEWIDDDEIRVYYGVGRGWATYKSLEEVEKDVLPWVARTMVELSKELSDLSRLQNIVLGVSTK